MHILADSKQEKNTDTNCNQCGQITQLTRHKKTDLQ